MIRNRHYLLRTSQSGWFAYEDGHFTTQADFGRATQHSSAEEVLRARGYAVELGLSQDGMRVYRIDVRLGDDPAAVYLHEEDWVEIEGQADENLLRRAKEKLTQQEWAAIARSVTKCT